ncbi:MAG: sugar transferase [Pseudomonadota bacterium]
MKSQSYSVGVGESAVEQLKPVYLNGPKRIIDVVFSLMILPFLAPIIAIMYILVRLDGGPGFFGQERVGLNGNVFKCWKMRSMVVDAEKALAEACACDAKVAEEWERMQKLEDDPRITRIGKFIRETSLDELPQIWNVLRGDMSIIGPRPFMVDQESIYKEAGGGDGYFKLRPGISGLWQTEGRGTTSFVSRIQYDNHYYANVSFGMDLWILFRTVVVVLRRTGA